MHEKAATFLAGYLSTISDIERSKIPSMTSGYFCADEESANTCAKLISDGTKIATCSMKVWYESEAEQYPECGGLQVVTNWQDEPSSIIEISAVRESRFCDVDEAFAKSEGEGDQTLAWWRSVHWEFFSVECEELGIQAAEDMLLVLEDFRVVYRA